MRETLPCSRVEHREMAEKTAKANVTPVRQRTQFTCMAASMAMCLQALGIKCDEDQVAQVMECHPLRGASWEDASACAQHYGCRIELVIPATLGLVKKWTDAGDPVMIGWNPEGRPWSHASVIFDVDDEKVHVADPNIPDPSATTRVVSHEDFHRRWSEKWPKYMVRRPAMRVTREITSDGRQVMASEKPMDTKTANMADRFLPLRILRRHIYAEKLAREIIKEMGDDLCRRVLGAIASKHYYPIETAGAAGLDLLYDFLRHIDVDELLDAMARDMSDEDALPVFDAVANTFGIRLASQRSDTVNEMTLQQYADGLANARRASDLRTEYTRPGLLTAEAVQRRLQGRYEEGEDVSMEEMVKKHGPEWKKQNEKHEDVVDKGKGPGDKKEEKKAAVDPATPDTESKPRGLSLTDMAQRLGRWAEGEDVPMEKMVEQAGPEWEANRDKHEDVVDKGKGPGDKKEKEASERRRLSWQQPAEKPKTASLSPEALKESFPTLNDKAAAVLADGITNAKTGSQVSHVMNMASMALDAQAVGTIKDDQAWDNFYGKVAAVYAEMGDPNASTLIYDTNRKAFFVGSWSAWVQNHESDGNKVASTDFSGTEKGQLIWL